MFDSNIKKLLHKAPSRCAVETLSKTRAVPAPAAAFAAERKRLGPGACAAMALFRGIPAIPATHTARNISAQPSKHVRIA